MKTRITKEKLLEEMKVEEFINENEELVDFIDPALLRKYWKTFGGMFLKKTKGITMGIRYTNTHGKFIENICLDDVYPYDIIEIMKFALKIKIDLFISVKRRAIPIKWIEKKESENKKE